MSIRLTSIKAKIMTDDMTRHGAIMVAFGLMAGLISYGFQLTMARMLTPAQYGTLYSLLSLLVILSIFSSAINNSVTKFASMFKAQGRLDRVNYLWRFSLKRALLIGLAGFLVLSLLSPLIAIFLNIDTNLFAFIIAQVLVFAVTMFFLRDLTKAGNEKVEIKGFHSYTALSMLAIAAFILLTNIDAVLVKHYLNPEAAGNYSAISTLGKIALIAPGGIVVAM